MRGKEKFSFRACKIHGTLERLHVIDEFRGDTGHALKNTPHARMRLDTPINPDFIGDEVHYE